MRAVDIIIKKRDRQELTTEEIDVFRRWHYQRRNPGLPGGSLGDGSADQRDERARNDRSYPGDGTLRRNAGSDPGWCRSRWINTRPAG